ncbi:hypothetical protein BDN70DRAFT_876101 [Pholiota conissans]|uniref:Protein kinase domain-containing protein n=1 Tax=Pholiota conissans TaxID=109636 RepID=A0A9P5Z6Q8_9AGAR|nr:hypothetical protein BDN70DRAFT_876101 [Pholiota conissans]
MAFPQSFSTTAECPFMEQSASTLTVKLSTSCTPVTASASRFVSFSEMEGPSRARVQLDSPVVNRASSPPPTSHSRSRIATSRMSNSGSFSSLLMSVRSRSKSKSTASVSERKPELETSMSWFGKAYDFMRPWDDDGGGEDEDGISVPEEQKQAFAETKGAVLETLKRMVQCTGDIALDVLVTGMDALEYVPEPVLQALAKTFIAIWKAVKQVSMNRLAILRLTHTCTTILEAICNEVEIAGPQVMQELSGPILVLEKSFESFLSLVQGQVDTPFLGRYLKRDETARSLAHCNDSLMRALTLFTTTIQIRTLAAVCANSRLQDAKYDDLKRTVQQAISGHMPLSPPLPVEQRRCSAPDLDDLPTSHTLLGVSSSQNTISRSTDDLLPIPQVVPVLQKLTTVQNLHDQESDVEDLDRSIKEVLKSGDDTKLLAFLGVKQQDMPEAIKTLQRTLETRALPTDAMGKDILHQEFLECGVEALRRLTSARGNNLVGNLPVWTITSLEVARGKRIGIGSFSQVYQGTWKGRVVAVKYLSDVTPYDLFIREIKVWKSLKHPNVLTLYGASSATANPPWFFVSPYMENNTLVHFLKHISRREEYEVQTLGPIAEDLPLSKSRSSYGTALLRVLKAADVYRILQEIARGMEYLHYRNVLHGDLKGSNVLVDKHYRCVISDFGQSEMKSEVYRITGSSMQPGTLRWKAPELLDGYCTLTPATDAYAYAIVAIEVLTMGDIPWGQETDDAVRINVLEKDRRPAIPLDYSSPLLHELIEGCWARNPDERFTFNQAVARLDRLRRIAGDISDPSGLLNGDASPLSPPVSPTCSSPRLPSPTPTPHTENRAVFGVIDDYVAIASPQEIGALQTEDTAKAEGTKMTDQPRFLHRTSVSSSATSRTLSARRRGASSDSESLCEPDEVGRYLPSSSNDAVEAMNERRYRYLLEHEFNASLTLPLWDPSHVQIGDVGYLRKPTGRFITLFNTLKPHKYANGLSHGLPPMAEYGNVARGSIRMDKRNVAQKGLDVFSGLLSFRSRSEPPIARRQTFRLRAGHKCAHLYTESAEYHYVKRLDAPKAWFHENADRILGVYGKEHGIQKEDLFLVISLLQAPHYALFVSHQHPEGQMHFNVFSRAKKGQPWGSFTIDDTQVATERNGPNYEESISEEHEHATKISNVNDHPKAVLIGRLRFKPDSSEPTTSK